MKSGLPLILTITLVLFTGCTDPLAGFETDTAADPENAAGKGFPMSAADLSLQLSVDNETPQVGDFLTFKLDLHNDGPHPATGVEVKFEVEVPGEDEGEGGGGLILWDIIHESASNAPNAAEENDRIVLWDIIHVQPGETTTLFITASVASPGTFNNTAEIIASNVFDTDSVPGDGDPTQDDYASIEFMIDE